MEMYSNLNLTNHRQHPFYAMVSSVDEGLGNKTAALKGSGLWENTLLVYQALQSAEAPTTPSEEARTLTGSPSSYDHERWPVTPSTAWSGSEWRRPHRRLVRHHAHIGRSGPCRYWQSSQPERYRQH